MSSSLIKVLIVQQAYEVCQGEYSFCLFIHLLVCMSQSIHCELSHQSFTLNLLDWSRLFSYLDHDAHISIVLHLVWTKLLGQYPGGAKLH